MNISNIVAVFTGGSKKGEASHDGEYGHGQEKRKPSTYVEGKTLLVKPKRQLSTQKIRNIN